MNNIPCIDFKPIELENKNIKSPEDVLKEIFLFIEDISNSSIETHQNKEINILKEV